MVKTTVYLPERLKEQIEGLARREGRSEADIIRAALDEFTAARERPRPTLPLVRGIEPITDWDEAMRGFGQD